MSKSKDPKAKFDHQVIKQQIQQVLIDKGLDPQLPLENPLSTACKVFVVATSIRAAGTPVLMRTYNNFPSVAAFPAKVWESARATTAAPTFFLPITIKDIDYADGGTGFNNPAELAIDEAHNIWPNRPIGCLVSVGTGLEDAIQLGTEAKGFARKLLSMASTGTSFNINVAEWCIALLTSSHSKHLQLMEQAKRLNIYGSYFRFDVPQGMSTIGLEDWEKLKDMIALTTQYMTYGIQDKKESVVKRLLYPNVAS
jgi:hypothetical protein